ncbi:MAG: Cytochrome c4 precursor [Pseudomonadota bacterium]
MRIPLNLMKSIKTGIAGCAWLLAANVLAQAPTSTPSPPLPQAQPAANPRSVPPKSARFEDNMAERTRACTACHGDQGRAGPDGYYPRLAGKPAGYLHNQLRNFAQGRRHYELMTRLIDPLSDDYMGEMARYFSALSLPYPPPSANNTIAKERLARGQQLVTQGDAARGLPACTQCHGVRLTGVQPHVPGLLGLPLDYLNAQLGAWQTGQRKAHAPDCMAEVVKRIPSEDLIAVSSWLARQPLPADTHPATKPPAGPPLPATLRCGSAPELPVAAGGQS